MVIKRSSEEERTGCCCMAPLDDLERCIMRNLEETEGLTTRDAGDGGKEDDDMTIMDELRAAARCMCSKDEDGAQCCFLISWLRIIFLLPTITEK